MATLPSVDVDQGIYREIADTTFYKTSVDVRVDQLGDVDPSVNVEDPNNPGSSFAAVRAAPRISMTGRWQSVGTYDPKVDGVFNTESFTNAEISLINSKDPSLTQPSLR